MQYQMILFSKCQLHTILSKLQKLITAVDWWSLLIQWVTFSIFDTSSWFSVFVGLLSKKEPSNNFWGKSVKMASPVDKRVAELQIEEGRPRTESSDSQGSRVRAWSGVNFDDQGRTRTFSFGGKKKKIIAIAIDSSELCERAFDCEFPFHVHFYHLEDLQILTEKSFLIFIER